MHVHESRSVTQNRRIEHKFQKLSSNIRVEELEIEAVQFDKQFENMVREEEISNLQDDFSKLSWDTSASPTTNTLGDIGPTTPDNIQDILAGIKYSIKNKIIIDVFSFKKILNKSFCNLEMLFV